jgi:predicted DCC family thiol-disulfide oxidoreductase YuxK
VRSAPASRALYTLVYDGDCRVCTRSVNIVRKWDTRREIEIKAYQEAGVTARFPWIPATAFAEAIQLIGPRGVTWQGAAAVERLLDVVPRGRWIAWIFKIPFVRTAAEKFYRWFARNRYRFGCSDHCTP